MPCRFSFIRRQKTPRTKRLYRGGDVSGRLEPCRERQKTSPLNLKYRFLSVLIPFGMFVITLRMWHHLQLAQAASGRFATSQEETPGHKHESLSPFPGLPRSRRQKTKPQKCQSGRVETAAQHVSSKMPQMETLSMYA